MFRHSRLQKGRVREMVATFFVLEVPDHKSAMLIYSGPVLPN